jgi:peptide chain release factor 2
VVKFLATTVFSSLEVLDGKIDLFIKAYLKQLYLATSGDKEVLDNFK